MPLAMIGREAHLDGPIAAARMAHAQGLVATPSQIGQPTVRR